MGILCSSCPRFGYSGGQEESIPSSPYVPTTRNGESLNRAKLSIPRVPMQLTADDVLTAAEIKSFRKDHMNIANRRKFNKSLKLNHNDDTSNTNRVDNTSKPHREHPLKTWKFQEFWYT